MGLAEITLDRKGQRLLPNWDSDGSQVWGIFCPVRGLANTPLRIWSEGSSCRRKVGRQGLDAHLTPKFYN